MKKDYMKFKRWLRLNGIVLIGENNKQSLYTNIRQMFNTSKEYPIIKTFLYDHNGLIIPSKHKNSFIKFGKILLERVDIDTIKLTFKVNSIYSSYSGSKKLVMKRCDILPYRKVNILN